MTKAMDNDVYLGVSELVYGVLDMCLGDPTKPPDGDPEDLLHALGRVACEIALNFKIDIDDAIAAVAKAAHALEQTCRQNGGDYAAAPRAVLEREGVER